MARCLCLQSAADPLAHAQRRTPRLPASARSTEAAGAIPRLAKQIIQTEGGSRSTKTRCLPKSGGLGVVFYRFLMQGRSCAGEKMQLSGEIGEHGFWHDACLLPKRLRLGLHQQFRSQPPDKERDIRNRVPSAGAGFGRKPFSRGQ